MEKDRVCRDPNWCDTQCPLKANICEVWGNVLLCFEIRITMTRSNSFTYTSDFKHYKFLGFAESLILVRNSIIDVFNLHYSFNYFKKIIF